jgi:hypothetical protein
MATFDPGRAAMVHDRLDNRVFTWRANWVSEYRQQARSDKVDGTVVWDGLVLDGWEPIARPH